MALITGSGTGDPQYTGPNAAAQYRSIFGTTDSLMYFAWANGSPSG